MLFRWYFSVVRIRFWICNVRLNSRPNKVEIFRVCVFGWNQRNLLRFARLISISISISIYRWIGISVGCVFVYNSMRRFPFSNCLLPQATGYSSQCAMIAMWHSLDQMRKYLLELDDWFVHMVSSFIEHDNKLTKSMCVTRGALY